MSFHGIPTLRPVLTVSMVAVALTGCFGGSSGSSGGGGSGTVSLTEEEQVVGAALTGMNQASAARGFAESQAEAQDDPTEDSTTTAALVAASAYTGGPGDEVPLIFSCPNSGAGSEFGGEGEYRIDEGGNLIAIRDIDFPSPHFQNAQSMGSGTEQDALLRSNCLVTLNGEEFFRVTGSADIAQEEDIDGQAHNRAVYARIGGHTGSLVGDTPDTDGAMETGFQVDDTFFQSRFQAEIYACAGCINGNLEDFNGDPALDTTSVSFMDMNINLSNVSASYQVGNSIADPFIMTTADANGTGRAEVNLTGRLKFADSDSGCGYDVTYATDQALLIDDYAQDEGAETVGGQLNVTLNETGNSYTVTYQPDGEVQVTDSSGNNVTPEPSSDAQSCGFVTGSLDSGSTTDAAALEGQWVSPCNQLNQDSWVIHTYDFASSTVDLKLDLYSDDSCSTLDQANTLQYNYSLGDAVPQSDGRGDAAEIDFTSASEDDIFDIVRIEDDTLYFGEPSPFAMPDSEAVRPDSIDTFTEWLYTKQ